MTWREAVLLMRAIANEPGSRVHAALAGWQYPMSYRDMDTRLLTLTVMHALSGGERTPTHVPWPWEAAPEAPATGEERALLIARLKANSAIPD